MSAQLSTKIRPQKRFRNGDSQAVHIPKEMVFNTDEVQLHREGDRLIAEHKAKTLGELTQQMGKPLDWNWAANDETVASSSASQNLK